MYKYFSILFFFAVSTSIAQDVDTIKVMYYNVLNFPGSTPERVEYFEEITHYALPDVVVINELTNEAGADLLLNDGLNTNGINHYARADFIDGYDSDNMLFYNSELLLLQNQKTIETELRLISKYKLYNKNSALSGDTVFLNFFSAHLKASSGNQNEQLRLEEVEQFTSYINGLDVAENIIFGGDFNFYDADEPAYQHLINNSPVAISDPLGESWPGDWHNNEDYANIHTQSTRARQFGGGAHGGLDDRFDFAFFSDDIFEGNNALDYIEGSYYALGNDGNHFNDSINAEPNLAVPSNIANALHYMSDHLPVVFDLTVTISETIQEIGVIKPSLNEIVPSGETYPIQWNSINIDSIDICFKTEDETTWTEVATSIGSEQETYNWVTPAYDSTRCQIKLQSSSEPEINTISELFTIKKQPSFVNNYLKQDKHSIKIYPNPSTGKIIIEAKEHSKKHKAHIYSAHGQEIDSFTFQDRHIIDLPTGIYFIVSNDFSELVLVK